MNRLRHKTFLFTLAAVVPFWVDSAQRTVGELGQAPLITLQRESHAGSLTLLRWTLDLSAEQRTTLDQLIAEASDRLDDLRAEALSARMAADLTAEDSPAAARRQREFAAAQVEWIHAQRLLEQRLRAQLTPDQVAHLEHWEERARSLRGGFAALGLARE